MKLYSWNVNGIRAIQKKGFLEWVEATQPDILCLQETKAHPDQLDDALKHIGGYHAHWAHSVKKGYSGVVTYSRVEPKAVTVGLGFPQYDDEGRTLITEYDDFVLLNAYFPNGSEGNKRVPYKMGYCGDFVTYCDNLQAQGKNVIFCGDVNTSHKEIDLANPKSNVKNTGFLPEERAWMDTLVGAGYIDTFRYLYPDKTEAYSYWSERTRARERNAGWRLDYFFVSPNLKDRISAAEIHTDILGSDHCPISLTLR
jgi:exodeoxyribonuclease III